MAKVAGNEVRPGMVIELNGQLWSVVKTQSVKPGKGGATLSCRRGCANRPFESRGRCSDAGVARCPSTRVQTRAKELDQLCVIELPFNVRGPRARESLKILPFDILNALISQAAANGLPRH